MFNNSARGTFGTIKKAFSYHLYWKKQELAADYFQDTADSLHGILLETGFDGISMDVSVPLMTRIFRRFGVSIGFELNVDRAGQVYIGAGGGPKVSMGSSISFVKILTPNVSAQQFFSGYEASVTWSAGHAMHGSTVTNSGGMSYDVGIDSGNGIGETANYSTCLNCSYESQYQGW